MYGVVQSINTDASALGVTVSMADSTGTTLTEISFSGVTGSPSPSITEFEITDGNFSQQFILNILGLITKE